jgi:predicted nucleic acid-binding protein
MAGSKKYTALLDANVLYSGTLTDILIRFHRAEIYRARWSKDIIDELQRNLVKNLSNEKITKRINLMHRAVIDSTISGYEPLINCIDLWPDQDDRHVLAAAVCGHCDAIVTFNLKHFDKKYLEPLNLVAIHPDSFILDQLTLDEPLALGAIHQMLLEWKGDNRFDRLIQHLRTQRLYDCADYLFEYKEILNV